MHMVEIRFLPVMEQAVMERRAQVDTVHMVKVVSQLEVQADTIRMEEVSRHQVPVDTMHMEASRPLEVQADITHMVGQSRECILVTLV